MLTVTHFTVQNTQGERTIVDRTPTLDVLFQLTFLSANDRLLITTTQGMTHEQMLFLHDSLGCWIAAQGRDSI